MRCAGYRAYAVALAVVVAQVFAVQTADAQTLLNQEALFRRCYAHLTQLRPKLDDSMLAQVKAGTKTALQACQEVLNRARFTAGGGTLIQDPSDAVAKAVLHTFNELHRSWAREQTLFNPGNANSEGTETWNDDSPMGPYITRALFAPGFDVDSITQGSAFLQPVRDLMDPPRVYRGVPSSQAGSERDWRLGEAHPFAPKGDILGIRSVHIPPIAFSPVTRFPDLSSMPDFANIGAPPAATAPISSINFAAVDSVKGPLSEVEHFAIRIQGQLLVPNSGSYTLYLNVDDAGSLIIDGNRLFSRGSPGEGSGSISLSQGAHDIVIEYRQRTAGARLIMSWQGPGFSKQVVPGSAFSNLNASYHTHFQALPFQFTGSGGGGYLGSYNYFLTTFLEGSQNFVPNGALVVNRSWARAVFSDALCREIPVVREEDVQHLVLPASSLAFRQAAACNTCHASLDGGLSGLIRGLTWNSLNRITQDSPLPDLYGFNTVVTKAPSLGESTAWSDEADNDYWRRSPYGRFYFRNLRGELVNQPVRTIEELGQVIRSQDDYYACIAKRYYHYFTGIDVELGDPEAPGYQERNAVDEFHYQQVIGLGSNLKNSKSLSGLIMGILASQQYRMSDYGVSYDGAAP